MRAETSGAQAAKQCHQDKPGHFQERQRARVATMEFPAGKHTVQDSGAESPASPNASIQATHKENFLKGISQEGMKGTL